MVHSVFKNIILSLTYIVVTYKLRNYVKNKTCLKYIICCNLSAKKYTVYFKTKINLNRIVKKENLFIIHLRLHVKYIHLNL